MEITLKEVSVRDLVKGYVDNQEAGVFGYDGNLDIRPPYQREFIYKDKQREAVIRTILQGFPLNVMYWADNGDGKYEVIDGQQRTISVCQYVNGDYSYDFKYFHNQPADVQDKILDYKLMVYTCKGTDSEKLSWFKTINIAGEKLTEQELRNAVYAGPWVSDAKRHFSKTGCPAWRLAEKYVNGSPIRQDFLETAVFWMSNGQIEEYMGQHQQDPNANALWLYFKSVIEWAQQTFPKYRKEMKGVDWGGLYENYHENVYDTAALEEKVARLMADSDVQQKKGIYYYVLDHDEHHLGIRAFDANTKREVYERQHGICAICGKPFGIEFMEADHITPWAKGGHTVVENCQMLCQECNRRKSDK